MSLSLSSSIAPHFFYISGLIPRVMAESGLKPAPTEVDSFVEFSGLNWKVMIESDVFWPLTPKKSKKAMELCKSAMATIDTFLQLLKMVQA